MFIQDGIQIIRVLVNRMVKAGQEYVTEKEIGGDLGDMEMGLGTEDVSQRGSSEDESLEMTSSDDEGTEDEFNQVHLTGVISHNVSLQSPDNQYQESQQFSNSNLTLPRVKKSKKSLKLSQPKIMCQTMMKLT